MRFDSTCDLMIHKFKHKVLFSGLSYDRKVAILLEKLKVLFASKSLHCVNNGQL